MASAEAVETTAGSGMEQLLIEDIRAFCKRCDEIIKRGYLEIIKGHPTGELLQRHRSELQWGLRLARLFRRITSASDFRDAAAASLLEAKLRQLEEHWKYIYEPPSKEESEKLHAVMQEVFPHAP